MELVLLMYNVHPYFSLKNLGKSVYYTWQNGHNTVIHFSFKGLRVATMEKIRKKFYR